MAMKNVNESLVELLHDLSLTPSEAITYTAMLETGSVSIRKIAAQTGINRGSTYDAMKSLVRQGLATVKTNGKREQFVAESPEKIYDIIHEKRRDLLEATNKAKDIVPDLLARHAVTGGAPIVKYYEQDDGIAVILKDVITTCARLPKPLYYAYSSSLVRQYLYKKYPQFTERRIQQGIAVRVIAVGEGGEPAGHSERRWLPDPPKDGLSSYTLIYGNKIATISIAANNTPYGVVIEDEGAAAMQRQLFNYLWKQLGTKAKP